MTVDASYALSAAACVAMPAPPPLPLQVGQWADEASSKTVGSVRIHQYHGSQRVRDPKRLAEFDVVGCTAGGAAVVWGCCCCCCLPFAIHPVLCAAAFACGQCKPRSRRTRVERRPAAFRRRGATGTSLLTSRQCSVYRTPCTVHVVALVGCPHPHRPGQGRLPHAVLCCAAPCVVLPLCCAVHQVVTTYQTLQSDHGSQADPCQRIEWHRIVFDEGHTLRSASTKLFKVHARTCRMHAPAVAAWPSACDQPALGLPLASVLQPSPRRPDDVLPATSLSCPPCPNTFEFRRRPWS